MTMAATVRIDSGIMIDEPDSPLSRLRSGDPFAFKLIFERHHRLVLGFLYGMIGENDIAEELTQETFMRAYKGIHTLRDESKVATWLCGIAKNVAYNSLRSRRATDQNVELDEAASNLVQSRETSPDSGLLNKELHRVIHDALSQLDEDKRVVFTLKTMQNLSYIEIAKITGSSIPKLKTDLHRAKAQMRRSIHPYLEGANEL